MSYHDVVRVAIPVEANTGINPYFFGYTQDGFMLSTSASEIEFKSQTISVIGYAGITMLSSYDENPCPGTGSFFLVSKSQLTQQQVGKKDSKFLIEGMVNKDAFVDGHLAQDKKGATYLCPAAN